MIASLLLFSADFQERLEEVEKSFEDRRTVADGLDATVTVVRKDREVNLKLRSILRARAQELRPPAPSTVGK